jgi:hypothetical protein
VLDVTADKQKPKLTAFDERAISVDALVDPRTLRKALAGERVQPMTRVRIRTALEARGLAHLLPDATPGELLAFQAGPGGRE